MITMQELEKLREDEKMIILLRETLKDIHYPAAEEWMKTLNYVTEGQYLEEK